jgi:trk system potassium uptake protein TrkA
MRIIVAGLGDVGHQLAKKLSNEKNDIIAIDIDENKLSRLLDSADILTLHGSSTSIKTLQKAQVDGADLLVSVTSSEEVNIMTCIIGKKLGAKKTIARIANEEYLEPDNQEYFAKIGIDFMIYPEDLAAKEIVNLINRTAATDIVEFQKGKISVIGLRLDKNAPIIQKSISEVSKLNPSTDFRVVAIYRAFRTIIPKGNDKFLPNDQVFVISKSEAIEQVLKLAGKEDIKFNNIMILGGGKIGRKVASLISNKMNVKIIDSNQHKAEELAESLPQTLVIQGDGRDIDLLAQEGIIDVDAYIAVTEDAETNIISCLLAKHLGVKKTIALVDKVEYVPLTQTIGLDSLINKKLIAANNISRYIKRGELLSYASLEGIDAEVLEFKAHFGSDITKDLIKDLDFPKGAIVGGIVRGDESIIATGNTQIKPGDRVVVICLPDKVSEVEKLFKQL